MLVPGIKLRSSGMDPYTLIYLSGHILANKGGGYKKEGHIYSLIVAPNYDINGECNISS